MDSKIIFEGLNTIFLNLKNVEKNEENLAYLEFIIEQNKHKKEIGKSYDKEYLLFLMQELLNLIDEEKIIVKRNLLDKIK